MKGGYKDKWVNEACIWFIIMHDWTVHIIEKLLVEVLQTQCPCVSKPRLSLRKKITVDESYLCKDFYTGYISDTVIFMY